MILPHSHTRARTSECVCTCDVVKSRPEIWILRSDEVRDVWRTCIKYVSITWNFVGRTYSEVKVNTETWYTIGRTNFFFTNTLGGLGRQYSNRNFSEWLFNRRRKGVEHKRVGALLCPSRIGPLFPCFPVP